MNVQARIALPQEAHLEFFNIADPFERRYLKRSPRTRRIRGLVEDWPNPTARLLDLGWCPAVVLHEVVDVVRVDVMQRTTRPRVAERTICVSTIDIDQSPIRTPYADMDAPPILVIYCDKRPPLLLLQRESKAVTLTCPKSQSSPVVEHARFDEMDNIGRPPELDYFDNHVSTLHGASGSGAFLAEAGYAVGVTPGNPRRADTGRNGDQRVRRS